MGLKVHSIDAIQPGQVWYHYGWCRWYWIRKRIGKGADCIVFRQDGSSYRTFVYQSFIAYGGYKVFNRMTMR